MGVEQTWTGALAEERLIVRGTFIDCRQEPSSGAVRRTRSHPVSRDRQDDVEDSSWDKYLHTLVTSAGSLVKECMDDKDNIQSVETVKEGLDDEGSIQNAEAVKQVLDNEDDILNFETRTSSVSTAPPPLGLSDSEDWQEDAETASAASATLPSTPQVSSTTSLGRTPLKSKAEPFRPSLNSKAEPFRPTLNYQELPTVPMAAVDQAWSAFYSKRRKPAYGQYDAWAASRHMPHRGRWA